MVRFGLYLLTISLSSFSTRGTSSLQRTLPLEMTTFCLFLMAGVEDYSTTKYISELVLPTPNGFVFPVFKLFTEYDLSTGRRIGAVCADFVDLDRL